jgi:hypothetical protein
VDNGHLFGKPGMAVDGNNLCCPEHFRLSMSMCLMWYIS